MGNRSRRDFIKTLGAGTTALNIFGSGIFAGCADAAGKKPNIVLILADDVGREILGCYGGGSHETPNLDSLSQKGMRFEHVYCAPVCHPSRLSLLTGRYPFELGNYDFGTFPVYAEKQTFAHQLRRAGYATAVAGKWQLAMLKDDVDHPHRLGFDEYCLFGWHEGPRYHDPHIRQNGKLRNDVKGKYGPDIYSDFLIDFMKKNRAGPFLAYYPMALCHDVSNDLETPPPYGPKGRYENAAEMIVEMDRIVGKMAAAVSDLGLVENTLFIFTSDNGTNPRSIIGHENGDFVKETVESEFKGRMVRGGKKSLNDWGTRVPTLAVWPGKIKVASVCDELIDFSDFLPTLNDIALSPAPSFPVTGHSFAGLLNGEPYRPRDWVYSGSRDGESYWIRTKDWKLYNDGRLYHMLVDEDEKNPILSLNDSSESEQARSDIRTIMNELRPGV